MNGCNFEWVYGWLLICLAQNSTFRSRRKNTLFCFHKFSWSSYRLSFFVERKKRLCMRQEPVAGWTLRLTNAARCLHSAAGACPRFRRLLLSYYRWGFFVFFLRDHRHIFFSSSSLFISWLDPSDRFDGPSRRSLRTPAVEVESGF